MVQQANVNAAQLRLIDLRHPYYNNLVEEWTLWRNTYESGRAFIDTYLKEFSNREDKTDFLNRKEMTPCPSFAAAAVDDVKNSIYQRMIDISRQGGSKSYQEAITGANNGVDLLGSSMNYLVGQKILPELLVMKRVGIYVDMPPLDEVTQLDASVKKVRPYMYLYQAEEILNWTWDESAGPNEYSQILLKESYTLVHRDFGFAYGTDTRYRHMYINADGQVQVAYYNNANQLIDEYGDQTSEKTTLTIRRIPFVVLEIPHSLLKDIARFQIALLNMGSSDINYVLKANFPFYTEQQDWRAVSPHLRGPNPDGAGSNAASESGNDTKEITVGAASGRAYGPTMDRPGFIHPSAEPLKASMDKQEQLKRDIRLLLNLALTNMTPVKQQSAESKGMDSQGLEAGLSFIGLELERAENRIAEFWAMYEKTEAATIQYPTRYSLKSDEERRAEVKQYKEMLPVIPSPTLQKQISKQLARALVGYKVSRQDMEKIEKEIDEAPFILCDPLVVQKNVELGILDRANAGKGFLYPADAMQKANQEHADRLQRIAESQASGKQLTNEAARGVPDLSVDSGDGAASEKELSRNNDASGDTTSNVRGPGANNGQPA